MAETACKYKTDMVNFISSLRKILCSLAMFVGLRKLQSNGAIGRYPLGAKGILPPTSYIRRVKEMRKFAALLSVFAVLVCSVPVQGASVFKIECITCSCNADNELNVISYDATKNAPDYSLRIAGRYTGGDKAYKMKGIADGVFAGENLSYVYVENTSGLTIGARAFQGAKVGRISGSAVSSHQFEIVGTNGSVTDIGDEAFAGLSTEDDFVIKGLAHCMIGKGAFQNIKVTGEFILAGSVDTLGDYACAGLSAEYMVIPKKIRHFGTGVFQGTGIENFEIGEEVESLGSQMFAGCSRLKTITLPNVSNLTSVAKDTFPDREDLTIVITNEQTDLSMYHFKNYPHLVFQTGKDIAFDSPVMRYIIANNLTFKQGEDGDVVSPEDTGYPTQSPGIDTPATDPPAATTIPATESPAATAIPATESPVATAIPATESLAATAIPVTESPAATAIPVTVPPVIVPATESPAAVPATEKPAAEPARREASPVYVIKQIKYRIRGKNTVSVIGCTGKIKSKLTVPDTVQISGRLYKVVKIEPKAFRKNGRIKKAVLGDFVTEVGKEAFAGCRKLTRIQFGKGVARLGKRVLQGDKHLKKIVFRGRKLKAIGKKAFSGVPKSVDILVSAKKAQYYKKLINRSNS